MTALEDKLSGYKEPSSDDEKDKQERAERMVREGVAAWSGFGGVSIRYLPKGSYKNNTNVKKDSDVDIAVINTELYYYDVSLLSASDQAAVNGNTTPATAPLQGAALRIELEKALGAKFGAACDTTGKTAITISENSGRVSADAVPSFPYRLYYYDSSKVAYVEGTKTFRKNGSEVVNYPEQQYTNGVAKNNRTGRRYKFLVRILKRLENDLVAAGKIAELPSYFMECLVYRVPDNLFGHAGLTPLTDDLKSVLGYLWQETNSGDAEAWYEPNEVKKLFNAGQPWSMQDAENLALTAWGHLGLGS
jgi:hypothetical protein